MKRKLQWGLIGTGAIARKFANGLRESRTGELAAIGSRSQESARRFAAEFPAACHGSYEALLADPCVDAVYISTPHPMHAEWAIKAAKAGKHILCEKPLAMNHAEALAVVEAARRNDVFLMEAFMYRCHPQTTKLVELVRAKTIGEVRLIQATFSFACQYDLGSRLLNHALGGGGILDVGCYCASMARLIAGVVAGTDFEDPVEVHAAGHIGAESRVDEYAIALLKFPSDMLAQLSAGVQLDLGSQVRIHGTDGAIFVTSPWMASPGAGLANIVVARQGVQEEMLIQADRSIYAIEADTVAEFIEQRQGPMMSWADSLGNMKTLDRWRAAIGLVYDHESGAVQPK